MAHVVNLMAYRRRRAAARGEVLFAPGGDVFQRVVWQNWILLTVLSQCVQLGREVGVADAGVLGLREAGVLSIRDAHVIESAVRRYLHPNRPLPRTRRQRLLGLSRRLEARLVAWQATLTPAS